MPTSFFKGKCKKPTSFFKGHFEKADKFLQREMQKADKFFQREIQPQPFEKTFRLFKGICLKNLSAFEGAPYSLPIYY